MKLSDMFPSEYFRGIDIGKPIIVTISAVIAEQAKNFMTGEAKTEWVMKFHETPKKLRLNLTMVKACALFLESTENPEEIDPENWVGKKVTIYRTMTKVKKEEHLVPRIRKPEQGDVDMAKAIKQAKNGKPTNGKGKAPTNAQELMALVNSQVEGSYQDEPALYEAIVSVLGDNWTWPKPENTEGWRAAFKAAKEVAEKKAEAIQDGFDLERQEALAETGSYKEDM